MLSSSLNTGRFFRLRLTCFRLRDTTARALRSFVGFRQRSCVETLTKSGECSLAVLKRVLFRVPVVVGERSTTRLTHFTIVISKQIKILDYCAPSCSSYSCFVVVLVKVDDLGVLTQGSQRKDVGRRNLRQRIW